MELSKIVLNAFRFNHLNWYLSVSEIEFIGLSLNIKMSIIVFIFFWLIDNRISGLIGGNAYHLLNIVLLIVHYIAGIDINASATSV